MRARIKILKNYKEIEENKEIRERELETYGKYSTEELKEEFIYRPMFFRMEDVVRAFVSTEETDMVIEFKDGNSYTIANDTDVYDYLQMVFGSQAYSISYKSGFKPKKFNPKFKSKAPYKRYNKFSPRPDISTSSEQQSPSEEI